MPGFILLAVLGFIAYRLTTAEQRKRYLGDALDVARGLKTAATQPSPEADEFRSSLRERTPHLIVTRGIAAICVVVAGGMLLSATPFSDRETLLRWGASVGTLTTNGEWWRLATSAFVHTGLVHLIVNVAILFQLGAILERLVGRLTVAAVYVSAGVFAGLMSLSLYPVAVSVGSSAALLGLYGLLIALLAWSQFQPRTGDQNAVPAESSEQGELLEGGGYFELGDSLEQREHSDQGEYAAHEHDGENVSPVPVTIPPLVIKKLGFGFALFILYSAVSGFVGGAEFVGLIVGLMYGLAVGWPVVNRQPGPRLVAAVSAAAMTVAVVCALPLRNIADVKPEIARAIATEEQTAAAYQSSLEAFKKGRLSADALAAVAEQRNVPALQAVEARLEALRNVPPEYQSLVGDTREFLRLRCKSWQLRAEAIRKADAAVRRARDGTDAASRMQAEARFRSNMVAQGNAEGAERASLDVFQRIKQ
jgi:membrane associated rhomboid family serine protease